MNLREELNKLDHKALEENKEFYDLVTLYDGVNLTEKEKEELAKKLDGEDAEVVYDFLWGKFDKDNYDCDDCYGDYPLDESFKESSYPDASHADEPNSYEQVEKTLKEITNNFTEKDGSVRAYYKEEVDAAEKILKKYYKIVEVSGYDLIPGEQWYVIAYANLKENKGIKEGYDYFETEDAVYSIYNDKHLKHLKAWDNKPGFKYHKVEVSPFEYRSAYLTKDQKESFDESLKEAFKIGSNDIQTVKVYNPHNYTIQELRINNRNKTFERGNFTMGKPDKKTHNKQEYEDIVDKLIDMGYTEIPSDYPSLRNKTRKGVPTKREGLKESRYDDIWSPGFRVYYETVDGDSDEIEFETLKEARRKFNELEEDENVKYAQLLQLWENAKYRAPLDDEEIDYFQR